MFRTTLAHITSLAKTGFKSQLRNRRIIDVADAAKGQPRGIPCKYFTHGLVQCENLKRLDRPRLSTVCCNSQRCPNHSTCPAICAKAQHPKSGFSTSQHTRPRAEGASGRRKHKSIYSNIKRQCTSSSAAQLTTEHIKDTEKLPNIIKSIPAIPAVNSCPQLPKDSPAPKFALISGAHKVWSHRLYKSPDGKDIIVHYCKTLESAETIAGMFSDDPILGLDIEWKANASAADGILKNVSLIQLASSTRIALFHIAMFRPARGVGDLVPPTLKRILESPDITKAGVSIKADCTRLRKYLGIDTRAIFELSHLYKLVKYSQSNPGLINKRTVNLSAQVEEHFGIPLAKEVEVRCSDWASALDYAQVHYAAADPFACVCLFNTMNEKRMALEPMPPLPAHAELNLPIRIVHEIPVNTEPEVEVIEPIDNLLVETKERS
ncbi:putative 3-5 exonuclease [Aspergillus nomiae NRRL 13137]|uniref:Putative 3-5 exonuclease n=1 Tax=Aspergillus nomiae NRRL (strain ATCC 15546 / NRRL 13137 / CBS 260.88 / M93) TaxID=1509407 RepID=A0A0L1J378_ASPN3|nr:putative 3-5 exonuclease [Aspergillus nomiae NRRL 13137]KNG86115.1 putative 3-5 exonuclease [Aspergillus nomiae NRRL 13137]